MMTSAKWLVFALAVAIFYSQPAQAQTWQLTSGDGSWGTETNWSPQSVPNAVGAAVTFNAATATRTATLGDGNAYTIGSLSLTNTGSASTTIRNDSSNTGGAASLTFDATGSGPALITVDNGGGTATNQTLLTADMVFADTVDVNVLATTGSSAGAISITGNITGPGGMIKDGVGQMTTAFVSGQSSQVKNYQGPTTINNGRWRHSVGGTPTMTSSVTVSNGGQIDLITANSTYTYGSSSDTLLNLNGAGPTSGPFAPFPGAIRPDTNLVSTITNKVVLQTTSTVHAQGTSASLTFSGAVSGPGGFIAGSSVHDASVGQIVFDSATNSYTGGTTVNVGTLVAGGSSTTAFGTGNVSVVSANAVTAGSLAAIHLVSGENNAIADNATLSLAGGNTPGGADDGFINLDSGVNETVGGLILGGVTETIPGTYGASGSGAAHIFDEFFQGGGVVTLAVPAGVPGDYNGNGVVDMADYVLWRNGGPLQNEVASTGTVDAADYTAWRARFGNHAGSGSALGSSAVPEPSTILLISLLFSFGVSISRIRPAIGA